MSAKNIDKLYKTISRINEIVFESETAMKAASDYDLEKIDTKDALQKKFNNIRASIAKRGLTEGPDGKDENLQFIKSFLTEVGVSKNEAPILADAIVNDKLNEPYDDKRSMGDRLFGILKPNSKKITDKLKDDFEKYKDTRTTNAAIESILPNVEGYIETKIKSVGFEFSAKEKDKAFRKELRGDFNREDGVKERFFKLYGTMMEHGKNLAKGTTSTADFAAFSKQMQAEFGDAYLAEVDQALGVSAKSEAEAKKLRTEAYENKCKELYFKTTLAILSEKRKSDLAQKNDNIEYNEYIENNINNNYIKKLMRGKNDMGALCLIQPEENAPLSPSEERRLNKEMKDETAERQVVSLHHKLPIGAISDVYGKLFKDAKESEKFSKCSKMLHLFSNMCTVVGKEKHQDLEPKGVYEIKPSQDCLIFAARIESDKLEINRLKLPAYLKDGLKKYTQSKSTFDIGVSMKFSEPAEMVAVREHLKQEKTQESFVSRCISYFEKSKTA